MNDPEPLDEQHREAEIRGGDRPEDYIPGPAMGVQYHDNRPAYDLDDDEDDGHTVAL